jgi:Flp pilus assembly protein TadD
MLPPMMRSHLAAVALVSLFCSVTRAETQTERQALEQIDRGMALYKAGDLASARSAFSEAQRLAPDKANPYRLLGLVDARLGHCTEAAPEIETFLKLI